MCPFDSTAITTPDVPVNDTGQDEAGGEPSNDEAGSDYSDESDEENNLSVECGDGESHGWLCYTSHIYPGTSVPF